MTIRRIPVLAALLLPLAACALEPGDEATGSEDTISADHAALEGGSPITWRTLSAFLQGTGCHGTANPPTIPNEDAWAIAAGADVSMVFTRMTIDLPGNGADPSLAQRKNCSIRIPVTIARGFYVGQVTQTLSVGATKSDNVDIDGGARSTFFNLPLTSPHPHAFAGPGTAFNNGQLSAAMHDLFGPFSFCNVPGSNAIISGLFQSNLVVSGVRATSAENLIIGIDALDVRYDVQTQWFHCP